MGGRRGTRKKGEAPEERGGISGERSRGNPAGESCSLSLGGGAWLSSALLLPFSSASFLFCFSAPFLFCSSASSFSAFPLKFSLQISLENALTMVLYNRHTISYIDML